MRPYLHETAAGSPQSGGGRDLTSTDDDPPGLAFGQLAGRCAGGQCRVVGQGGAGADDDRVQFRAYPMAVFTGLWSGDPLTAAVRSGDPAVQAGGQFGRHVRATRAGAEQPFPQRAVGDLLGAADRDLDPGGGQFGCATGGDRIRVGDGIDQVPHAGRQQRLCAGAGPAGVGTGFESDHRGAAPGTLTGVPQGHHLGMRTTGGLGVTDPDQALIGVEDHRTDRGLGRESPRAARLAETARSIASGLPWWTCWAGYCADGRVCRALRWTGA